eukprot:GHVU01194883.1.p1 GENE.GHVU01194883.1~~GHVU01194883.1.p1  ORF type:complete len:136 (-),score=0.35 GHVU01194883.1:4-411(-)
MFAHAAGSRTAPAHTPFPPSSPSPPDRVELYAAPQDLHTHTHTHTILTQHHSPRRSAFASRHNRPYTNAYAHCLRFKTLNTHTHTDPTHALIQTHRCPLTHYPQGTHIVAKAVAGRPPQFMVHRPTLVLESSTPT